MINDQKLEIEMMKTYANFLSVLQANVDLHQKLADAAFTTSLSDLNAAQGLVNSFQHLADAIQYLTDALKVIVEIHHRS